MVRGADDGYFILIKETLVGRKAGGGAAEKARQARAADPLGTLIARIRRKHSEERAWRVGAHGEAFVGWLLKRLPAGWHVFNDVPVGERGANIDHLVIGPGGVFTINTKNLTGKVWVGPRTLLHNGFRTDYLPKAAEEAHRASRLLRAALGRHVEVRAALAIIVEELSVKAQPCDVFVGRPRGVKHWLLDQPTILTEREVTQIVGAAHKPPTWTEAVEGQPCSCGGEKVVRTRRSDGKPFLGCSRFPKCRYTWPLDPGAITH